MQVECAKCNMVSGFWVRGRGGRGGDYPTIVVNMKIKFNTTGMNNCISFSKQTLMNHFQYPACSTAGSIMRPWDKSK